MPVPICSDPPKTPWRAALMSPANSSPRRCAVQSTKFSTCRLTVPTMLCRLRHVAHVALSRCASRTQNAAVWRIARPIHVRMPEMRDIPYRGRWASKMARHRSVSPLSQTGAGMPPAGYFSSRLRRSLLLASFVRALAEAGPRRWSADKLSAGYQSALTVIAL